MANLPPATYTTFAELAEYAKQRAKISAARNGHQEFAYWQKVYEWADQGARLQKAAEEGWHGSCEPDEEFERIYNILASGPKLRRSSLGAFIHVYGEFYWKAVHLRRMLINRGEKPPRLSLKWLREAAEKL